jgi:RNA polymerase sigma factor (sigma-70 family)
MDDGRTADAWVREALARHEAPLLHYATRLLLGDRERARDAVQETFARLVPQDPAEVAAHLAEWLFTVCRRVALDIRRKEARMAPLNESLAEALAHRRAPSPADSLERRETSAQVQRALAALSETQQEVLRLKFQHGFSYKEIARVTGLSVSNVGVQIHLGLKRVRERLGVAASPPA